MDRISTDSKTAESGFRETARGQAVVALLKQKSPHMAKKVRWPLVLPHCLPFLKSPRSMPNEKVDDYPSIVRVFLRHQSKMTIIWSPSCPLPLSPSHPNFLRLWTENHEQEVKGVYHDALHPSGYGPHIEVILARKKAKNSNSNECWNCKFPWILLVWVSENQAVGWDDPISVQQSHKIYLLANPESRGNLSNLRISKQ